MAKRIGNPIGAGYFAFADTIPIATSVTDYYSTDYDVNAGSPVVIARTEDLSSGGPSGSGGLGGGSAPEPSALALAAIGFAACGIVRTRSLSKNCFVSF